MQTLKCKMCGGTLTINDDSGVTVCEYCGTKQTISKTTDDVISNLYNRANNLRLKNEFDKALSVYEKIVEQDDSEAEAHWGIVLCKFGIEYVDDPKTGKKIPTCHRTSFESIKSDIDYQAVIDYSSPDQQLLYEEEAREIDRLQKDILNIAKNEKPFDVFICYKETDENGKRTIDSVIANDIYYQLTQEGFKVFYSAITLEDKLGQEFEPYIFAALNSAKVMLVIGTKPEYFNAVWVKNEWSRFLSLMKKDRSKILIPCYRDMDAYDLPDEFAHLQAQDMSKIGFINDVIRGIKKIIVVDEPKKVPVSSNNKVTQEVNIEAILKRGFIFLEDSDFKSASEYFDRALDSDPENGEAYIGKLLSDLKLNNIEQISEYNGDLSKNYNYQKCQKYLFGDLKNQLETQIEIKQQKTLNKKIEESKKLISKKNILSFKKAKSILEQLPKNEEVLGLIDECNTSLSARKRKISVNPKIAVAMIVILVAGAGIYLLINRKHLIGKAKVGDTVLFGEYEQDGNDSNGKEPIEWICLAKEDSEVLLLSKYAIDYSSFAINGDEFISSSFDNTERNKIISREGVLLSSRNLALLDDSCKKCSYTLTALKKGRMSDAGVEEDCEWWLHGDYRYKYYLDKSGNLVKLSTNEGSMFSKRGFRPAIWVSLD